MGTDYILYFFAFEEKESIKITVCAPCAYGKQYFLDQVT